MDGLACVWVHSPGAGGSGGSGFLSIGSIFGNVTGANITMIDTNTTGSAAGELHFEL
jgi:hypothetical protein